MNKLDDSCMITGQQQDNYYMNKMDDNCMKTG